MVILIAGASHTGKTLLAQRLLERYHVPTFLFINKMDLPDANADKILLNMQQNNLTSEDWGGKVGVVKGSWIMLPIFILGFPLFLIKAGVYPALALISVGLGTYTTLLPIVTRNAVGAEKFAATCTLNTLKWKVLNNGSNLRRACLHHQLVVCRIVRDITRYCVLLKATNSVLETRCARKCPATSIALIALIWHKWLIGSNSNRRSDCRHICHLWKCPRL